MVDEVVRSVSCTDCGEVLDLAAAAGTPCPACGSMRRTIAASINSEITVRESMKAKHKRPGVKRPLTELFTGWDLRRSVGDMVRKLRLIDRQNDRYVEHVETDSGEVLKSQDHRLSEHFGHGSAKRKT